MRSAEVITRLGPIDVRSSASDRDTAPRTLPGQPLEVVLERDGKEVRTQVTLIGRR